METTVRRVAIEPPDLVRETSALLESIVLIAIVALLVAGTSARRSAGAAALAPHQQLFLDQPAERQRFYRELRAAAEDVLRARSSDGRWPAVEALASELVEPFAGGDHRWALVVEGTHANYIGRSARSDWVVAIEEPPPALRGVRHPGVEESHRTLDDGTIVHVGFWYREPGGEVPAGKVLAQPARDGFREIVTGQPGPEEKSR